MLLQPFSVHHSPFIILHHSPFSLHHSPSFSLHNSPFIILHHSPFIISHHHSVVTFTISHHSVVTFTISLMPSSSSYTPLATNHFALLVQYPSHTCFPMRRRWHKPHPLLMRQKHPLRPINVGRTTTRQYHSR